MTMRFALAAALALLAAPALAQQPAPAVPAPAAAEDLVPVALETPMGRIVIALDRGRAPKTVANFLAYVDAKKFDGESFYRAMPYGEGEGLIQGGISSDAAKLYPPIPHEPTSQTGLKHVAGTVSMGRGEPGSARADFFILTTDIPGLDADPARDPGGRQR